MKAYISATSPRYAVWREVFGSDSVEILSPVPARLDGPEGPRHCYRMDVSALTLKQRALVCRYLSQRWKLPGDQVAALIDDPTHGFPIRAEDVIVPIQVQTSLFS